VIRNFRTNDVINALNISDLIITIHNQENMSMWKTSLLEFNNINVSHNPSKDMFVEEIIDQGL